MTETNKQTEIADTAQREPDDSSALDNARNDAPGLERKLQGEGNYDAARRYNDATRRFTEREDVEEAARAAAPTDADQARELEQAEQAGQERAQEEDRLLYRPEQLPGAEEADAKEADAEEEERAKDA